MAESGNQGDMKKERGKTTGGDRKQANRFGEDPAKFILEVVPGKKGGQFELPFGGHITIPTGSFGKKDVVTCCQVLPSDRYKYSPSLKCDEFLLSELFLLASRPKPLRKTVLLQLPFYPEPHEYIDIRVITRRIDNDEWHDIEFERVTNNNTVQFDASSDGIYVVVAGPRRETFEVPVNGCIYNSRLSKQISIRFPKRAIDANSTCHITILPINRDSMPDLQRDYPLDMCDLVALSNYVEIECITNTQFRRPVTVKLPLPTLDNTDDFLQEDMTVLQLVDGEWQLLEAPLKFTKSTVAFDTKAFSRYCVALARPQRRKRLKDVFRHLKNDHYVTRGDILPFLHIEEKTWTLWFDAVPNRQVERCIELRTNMGFRLIKPMVMLEEDDSPQESFSIRRNWRSNQNAPLPKKVVRRDLDLVRGRVFELNIGDGVRICNDDPGVNNSELQYEAHLPQSYRRFCIEPIVTDNNKELQLLTGILRIYVEDKSSKEGEKCVKAFDFDIRADEVSAYRHVEVEMKAPEPEPVVSAPELPEITIRPPVVEIKPVQTSEPILKEVKKPASRSFMRLIQPVRQPREAIRESKVLTGRSLSCLARQVEQGLTLAIYLGISDSTITGMGFDALAMGQSLVDITYRILLVWKRRTSRLKNRQVDILSNALGDMGRNDIAAILLDRHRQNLELTPDSFDITASE